MQVLLVLINKGRLCIYFCLLVHRRAVSGWPERVLLQLCGKLTQVLLSETCPSHLRLELFAFSLSLTHRHAHRHTDTRVPPAPGLPHGDQLRGGPAPRPCHPVAPPGRAASDGGFSKCRNTSRCFRTARNEGAEIYFMVSNRYQDYTGIPTRTTRCSQQIQRNRKINGESTTRNCRAGVG